MIQKEVWYKEALEKEIQKQFKDLPEERIGKMEQVLRIYMRTKKLPSEVSHKEALEYVFKKVRFFYSDKVEPEYYAVFWELLWEFLEYDSNPKDLNSIYNHWSPYSSIYLNTPREYRPKIPVEIVKYERSLDYSSLGLTPDNFESVMDYNAITETPWEFVDREVKEIPLLEALKAFAKMGRNPHESQGTPFVYYIDRPSWFRGTDILRDLVKSDLSPVMHQTRVEFDTTNLPGSWPVAIFHWQLTFRT